MIGPRCSQRALQISMGAGLQPPAGCCTADPEFRPPNTPMPEVLLHRALARNPAACKWTKFAKRTRASVRPRTNVSIRQSAVVSSVQSSLQDVLLDLQTWKALNSSVPHAKALSMSCSPTILASRPIFSSLSVMVSTTIVLSRSFFLVSAARTPV
jgi:hypothetical protein